MPVRLAAEKAEPSKGGGRHLVSNGQLQDFSRDCRGAGLGPGKPVTLTWLQAAEALGVGEGAF